MLRKKKHVINGKEVRVKLYLKCLGPSGGSDTPSDCAATTALQRQKAQEGDSLQYYDNKALVSNVPDGISRENLTEYLQNTARVNVVDILYGEEIGIIVATFDEELGLFTLPISLKEICGYFLKVVVRCLAQMGMAV